MSNDSGTCGIYKITRKDTGQSYIGLSENIEDRWHQHIHSPALKHSYIDRVIKKYGANRFDLEIIEELPDDRALLMEREEYWVAHYNTYEDDFHYNLTPGGDFSPMKVPEVRAKISGKNSPMYGRKGEEHPAYGYKHTPEAKAKMSKAKSGENNPNYGKKGKEHPAFGYKHTSEAKTKISKAMSGENNPMKNPEIVAKFYGKNNPFFGRKHTPEAKQKISEAHKGRIISKEHREILSKAHKGKKKSKEHRKKISKSRNTTGYFRVSKCKRPQYKQGFTYKYLYYENGKQRAISSVDIKKLEKKVKAKGLEWFKLDE